MPCFRQQEHLLAKPSPGERVPLLNPDAMYEKIRTHHRVVSKGVLIIIGVREDGYREILSVEITNTETKESWERVFQMCQIVSAK